ncbi:hypothetical protein CBS101457_006758 [Exobasidium rhododendri]|nr:hypothetical protein CBS101457_006758 [Exobasidium rhododendri]
MLSLALVLLTSPFVNCANVPRDRVTKRADYIDIPKCVLYQESDEGQSKKGKRWDRLAWLPWNPALTPADRPQYVQQRYALDGVDTSIGASFGPILGNPSQSSLINYAEPSAWPKKADKAQLKYVWNLKNNRAPVSYWLMAKDERCIVDNNDLQFKNEDVEVLTIFQRNKI